LKVLPEVVGNGAADVALQVGVIRHPPLRTRIEVAFLRHLFPIAPALPGKHRTRKSCLSGGCARLAQTAVTIHEQCPSDLRYAIVKEWEDEQLIPEDVALVTLAGPAARGHADIEPERVHRNGLQEVKHVPAQQHDGVQLRRVRGFNVNAEAAPDVSPKTDMRCHQLLETSRARDGFARFQATLRDGVIARTIKGSDLLQYERGALRELDRPFLRDVARFFDHAAWNIEKLSVAERLRAGGLRDVDVRLTGAHKQ